jgi:hypothetical protein
MYAAVISVKVLCKSWLTQQACKKELSTFNSRNSPCMKQSAQLALLQTLLVLLQLNMYDVKACIACVAQHAPRHTFGVDVSATRGHHAGMNCAADFTQVTHQSTSNAASLSQ